MNQTESNNSRYFKSVEKEQESWASMDKGLEYRNWFMRINALCLLISGVTAPYNDNEYVRNYTWLQYMNGLRDLFDVSHEVSSTIYKNAEKKFINWMNGDDILIHLENQEDAIAEEKKEYIQKRKKQGNDSAMKNLRIIIRLSRKILTKLLSNRSTMTFSNEFVELLHTELHLPSVGNVNGIFLLEFYFDYIKGEKYDPELINPISRTIYLCNQQECDFYSQKNRIIELYDDEDFLGSWKKREKTKGRSDRSLSQTEQRKMKDWAEFQSGYKKIRQRHEKTGTKGGDTLSVTARLMKELGLRSEDYGRSMDMRQRVENIQPWEIFCDLFDYIMDEWRYCKEKGYVKYKTNMRHLLDLFEVSLISGGVGLDKELSATNKRWRNDEEREHFYAFLCFSTEIKRYNLKKYIFYNQYIDFCIEKLVCLVLNHSFLGDSIRKNRELFNRIPFYNRKGYRNIEVARYIDKFSLLQIDSATDSLMAIFEEKNDLSRDILHEEKDLFQDISCVIIIKKYLQFSSPYWSHRENNIAVVSYDEERVDLFLRLCYGAINPTDEKLPSYNSAVKKRSLYLYMKSHMDDLSHLLQTRLTEKTLKDLLRKSIRFFAILDRYCPLRNLDSQNYYYLNFLIPIMQLIVGANDPNNADKKKILTKQISSLCHDCLPINELFEIKKVLYHQSFICHGLKCTSDAVTAYKDKQLKFLQKNLQNISDPSLLLSEIYNIFFVWCNLELVLSSHLATDYGIIKD